MADLSGSATMLFESATALYGLFLAYYAFSRGRIREDIDRNREEFERLLRYAWKVKSDDNPDALVYTLGETIREDRGSPLEERLAKLGGVAAPRGGTSGPAWASEKGLAKNGAQLDQRWMLLSRGLAVSSLFFLAICVLVIWQIFFVSQAIIVVPVPDLGSGMVAAICLLLFLLAGLGFTWVGSREFRIAADEYDERREVAMLFVQATWRNDPDRLRQIQELMPAKLPFWPKPPRVV